MKNQRMGQIDSLDGINLNTLKCSDIYWRYATGVAISHGSGRDKKYSYRSGVMTELGDIEESLWYQLAEGISKRDGDEWLVDALTEWECEHNYTGESAKGLRKKALQAYIDQLCDNPRWVGYIPFNRVYRPDVLKRTHIVTVINYCCWKPGQVTQEQIDSANQQKVYCPHCGRFSTYTILDSGELPWAECLEAPVQAKDRR